MLMRQQPITTWINTAIKPQNGWQFSLQQWVKPTTHDKLLMARQTKQNCDRIPPAPQSFRIKDNKNVNNKQETQGVLSI